MFRPQAGHHQASTEDIKRYNKVSTQLSAHFVVPFYIFCTGLMMADLRPKHVALMGTDIFGILCVVATFGFNT